MSDPRPGPSFWHWTLLAVGVIYLIVLVWQENMR